MIRYDIHKGVQKIKTKTFLAFSGLGLVLGGGAMSLAIMGSAHAADSNVVITGNTAIAENDPGWMFNRDASTSTPYSFTTTEHSIGNGSIYVAPIGATASNKFIAEDFLRAPVASVSSISYDFKVAGNGTPASANQFYLNVYTNFDNSTNFYKCRFDYAPVTGSTSAFTTASFLSTATPVNVQPRGLAGAEACPTTLAGMPAGSYIRAFSISVGDTSASDQGLAGYLDNVKVTTTDGVATADFEPKMVTVKIFKYVDDVKATAGSANNTAFPMVTTFTSPNLGNATNAPFNLSPTPWGGIGDPYEADFVGSVAGADYNASEVTSGNTVVGTTCSSGVSYALQGYSVGSDLAQAQAAAKTLTSPQFTNLQSDYTMIVWNKNCHPAIKAPKITFPANGAHITSAQATKIDWTSTPNAAHYQYRAFTDPAYTSPIYDSGLTLTSSEIPTPGTPNGDYYIQVRVQDTSDRISAYSNDATHPYVVHVEPATTPPTTKDECRNDGWKTFNSPSYKNKDKCIDYVVKHGHKVKGDVHYTAVNLKREAEFDMNTYDTNKGSFEYWDNNNDWYDVKVSSVKVSGNTAYFAGVVTKSKNNHYNGNWLFAEVKDGNPDKIWGTFTDQATATAGVNAMTDPAGGSFNVTKGNLKVN